MMDILLIIIGILILLTAAVLALRLRLQVELSDERKTVFFGLGRSGPFIDIDSGDGVIRLFGFSVRRFSVYAKDEDTSEQEPRDAAPSSDEPVDTTDEAAAAPHETAADETTEEPAEPLHRRLQRRLRMTSPVQLKTVARMALRFTRATRRYIWRLIRGTRIEQLDARIRGGFDEPDQTGQAYGYFQAVSGAIPFIGRHVQYYPDYTGQSLSGSFRMGLALPLYRLVGSTLLFLWDLPLREVIRLAIGKKKGADDVQ